MRLIDADALIEDTKNFSESYWVNWTSQKVMAWIDNAPTIEAEPVRHGRWIMRGGYFRCSECDAKALWERKGGTGGWSSEFEQAKTKVCPNCFAKMDKGEEE